MNFQPIDFDVYNKPPYYPQTYARGETKKLVSFDDDQFRELDRLIDVTSDQYDLEKARGILLDRLGKIVDEFRDGNDDELYRLLIRLRTILNTTSGSINDIIRIIKFIFGSEVVRIQPNYPAGLTILHDGESPSLNYNKYILQVVAAGVAFDTKELFYFTEKIDISEESKITVKQPVTEGFFGQIKHNGRIARDGKTIRDVEVNMFKHDGKKERDGTAQRNKIFWSPANSSIYRPFLHSSGALERFVIVMKNYDVEEYHGASEVMSEITGQMDMVELHHPVEESQFIKISKDFSDDMSKHIYRDGTIRRNREHIHHNFPADSHLMNASLEPEYDVAAGTLVRKGSFQRNGVEQRFRTGKKPIYELFRIGIRYHRLRNRKHRHNGAIQHNGNILIPLE